jgi:hypothetical protein
MDSWFKSTVAQTGFTKERIIELLKPEFGTFKPAKATGMLAYLMAVRDHEETQAMMNKQEKKKEQPIPICPICGNKTRGDSRWDGRYTKTKGWTCSLGGLQHFLWWRANNIRRTEGNPILYPEVEHASTTLTITTD